MSWSRLTLPAILLVAILFFLLFHERQLSGYDSASFVLAIKYGYSVQQSRPHGPGYPGFYLMWKGIEYVTSLAPHEVILAGNLLFLLSAILLTYWAALRLFDEQTAFLAAALLISNPLLLYFTCTTELYIYDAAFSAFLIVLFLVPPRRFETMLYFLYGLLGAFRLSSVILTFPVVLIVLYLRYRKTKTFWTLAMDIFAVLAGTLTWLIPFVSAIGGLRNSLEMLRGTAYLPVTFAQNISTFLPFHLWMVNILFIVIAWNSKKIWERIRALDERYVILAMLIVVPGSFFALKYYAKGYALLYLAPIALIGARMMIRNKRRTLWAVSAIAINVLIFFFVPFKEPSSRSVLSYAHRSMSERWPTALWRSTSFYAPTLAHLRRSDRMMEISHATLDPIPGGSYVIVDGSAAGYAVPRSLQVEFPQIIFLIPRTNDSTLFRSFFRDSMSDAFNPADLTPVSNLYYLTTLNLSTELGAPPGMLLLQNNPFELYSESIQNRDSLKHYLAALFYRGKQ